MSTKITKCDKCESTDITELNPENRMLVRFPLCEIKCRCNKCSYEFIIKSWTHSGKKRGILY